MKWLDALDKETDRGGAVLAAAFLDELIKELIFASFVSNEPRSGLGTFARKVQIAAATGLISVEVKSDLFVIGEIRNAFAHKRELIKFSDPPIAKLCDKLILPKVYPGNLRKGREQDREKYVTTAACTLRYLENRRTRIKQPVAPVKWLIE